MSPLREIGDWTIWFCWRRQLTKAHTHTHISLSIKTFDRTHPDRRTHSTLTSHLSAIHNIFYHHPHHRLNRYIESEHSSLAELMSSHQSIIDFHRMSLNFRLTFCQLKPVDDKHFVRTSLPPRLLHGCVCWCSPVGIGSLFDSLFSYFVVCAFENTKPFSTKTKNVLASWQHLMWSIIKIDGECAAKMMRKYRRIRCFHRDTFPHRSTHFSLCLLR